MANKIEVLKQAKDGFDVFPDLLRYAREGHAAIDPDDFERLKWYGLFHRKATPGYFMLRLRMPNGILTSEQMAAIGEIANRCGRGQADTTTRQNIQLRWIEIEDVPWIFQRLSAAGLTSQQSGMDNVRNVVGCPIAGLDPDELIDSRTLAVRLQQATIGHKAFSNLPRKFNLAITGCQDDCIHAQTHDLSFVPALAGDQRTTGFHVLVGGAMGGREPAYAQPLDVFIESGDVVPLATAILEVFRDHGPRESRLGALLKEPLLQTFSPNPSPWMRSVVTCTGGTEYCHFSLIDTKGEALKLARALDERYEIDAPVRLQMSGCPHSCGQRRPARSACWEAACAEARRSSTPHG